MIDDFDLLFDFSKKFLRSLFSFRYFQHETKKKHSSSTCADPGPVVGISKAKLNHPYDAVMDDKYLYVTDQGLCCLF